MIRLMEPPDVPAAMGLKESAGWNQTALDWERLLRLEPSGCFVEERGGVPVGSATALRHATALAWIGMVLVLPEHRRKGTARRLMHHSLAWLRSHGDPVVGLDATEMGRPLYCQIGFRDHEAIERWVGVPTGGGNGHPLLEAGRLPSGVLGMDREACGVDRSALLRDLAASVEVQGVCSRSGFVFGRPGSSAWQVGPCVAESASAAGPLIRALLASQVGRRVFWDLLPSNVRARRLAREMGFRPLRRLMRMYLVRSGQRMPPARTERIFATAGFEFG